ncbi:hypothetical protein EYF80_034818 [Liparis tanakae]|uniref:Uncharacterized protein n=1 Tax=Liparis tanakae TaxID=230148 RepID=A0A4Z2GP00_9TELE|nr:hypothetical protein EYF80_034818 [Liparis tanakae]
MTLYSGATRSAAGLLFVLSDSRTRASVEPGCRGTSRDASTQSQACRFILRPASFCHSASFEQQRGGDGRRREETGGDGRKSLSA